MKREQKDILERLTESSSNESSHELCLDAAKELYRLRQIEAAAVNLCRVRGRHNSEIAMKRLIESCGHYGDQK